MTSDKTQINAPSVPGGDFIAVDAITDGNGNVVKHQRVKVQFGSDGTASDVSSSNPLPIDIVSGSTTTEIAGLIDTNNTQSEITLNESDNFTGVFTDVVNYSEITNLLYTSGANKIGTLYYEFSMDGTTVHRSIPINVVDCANEPPHTLVPVARYFRVRYVPVVNGKNVHPNFQLQTILHPSKNKHLTSRMSQSIGDTTDVENVRAVISGKTVLGNYTNVISTEEGSLCVRSTSSNAFGDQVVVAPKPSIELQFPYTVDTANVIKFENGTGTVTSQDSQLVLSTGSTSLSDAAVASNDFLTYEPGAGAVARFSFGCTTTGSDGTFQQVGIGTQEDGFFFSYQSEDMTILIRSGGKRDQRSLVLTNEATGSGNLDITLDGTTFNVPVTTATLGEVNDTAAEIASFSYGSYLAYAQGNEVTFVAVRTGVKSGAFSFADPNGTGVTATLSQEVVGVTETTKSIARVDWNVDQADGTGVLPLIDWSKGNVFQIRYQWLGYGAQKFYIENPLDGNLVLVHIEDYANDNTVPSVNNPSLQFLVNVANALTTTNVTAFVGSAYAGIEGGTKDLFGKRHAETFSASVGNTAFENIVSFRAPRYFKGTSNRSVVSIIRLSITASASADFEIIKNADIAGDAAWTSTNNIILESFAGTETVTGGDVVVADRAEQKGRLVLNPDDVGSDQLVKVYPGDVVTICGRADTGTSSVGVAVNWVEPV